MDAPNPFTDTFKIEPLGPPPTKPIAQDLTQVRALRNRCRAAGCTGDHAVVMSLRHLDAYEAALQTAAYEASLFWNLAVGCLEALADLGVDVEALSSEADLARKDNHA